MNIIDTFSLSSELLPNEIKLLERIPSVKNRDINLRETLERNEVMILRDSQKRFLQCAFYYRFDDFVYLHTTIGKDKYKSTFFQLVLAKTVYYGVNYAVFFNSPESIRVAQENGGIELIFNNLDTKIQHLINQINDLTEREFYIDAPYLYDKLDYQKAKNPFFYFTKESYEKAVTKYNVLSTSC